MFLLYNRNTSFHGRRKRMKLGKATRSNRFRDSLVQLKDGRLAEIYKVEGENKFRGYVIRTSPYEPRIGIKLPWAKVGVWRYHGINYGAEVAFNYDDVRAKAVIIDNVITVWPSDWFMSKSDH